MAFAQGSRSQLTYVVENSWGVTPSSPAMIVLPKNTFNVNERKDKVESAEIRSDRQTAISRHGNVQINGPMEVDMRADDFDDLLESAFFGEFTLNVLKTGTTFKSLTMEYGQTDLSLYRQFLGCAVSKMAMNIAPNAMVKTTFDIVGKSMTTQATLDASPTAASTNEPFDSFTGTITEGGSPIASVTSLNFTLDNAENPNFVVGSSAAQSIEYGRAKVEGTITYHYENNTLVNKFLNETSSSITVAITDGVSGNTYTLTFPNVKYMGADIQLENEQSVFVTSSFDALYDAVSGCNLYITKS